MNLIAMLMQDSNQAQSYWFAFDWLVVVVIMAFSFVTAWAIYRFWLTGWVNHFREPFHLRLFAALVGLGLCFIAVGSYWREYKLHELDTQTFLIILAIVFLIWFLILLIEFVQGKRVRY